MSIYAPDFIELIDTTLKLLDPEIKYSEEARELLFLTASVESDLGRYMKQLGGPAIGVYQMEPETYKDIKENFLKYRVTLNNKIHSLFLPPETILRPAHELNLLKYDLMFATAMARVHYFRVPAPLPKTVEGMAHYWKTYYNTYEGKGQPEHAIEMYNRHRFER